MITVAFPIWNSKEIAWLPMEGLCRQQVNEDWEMLIVEEKHETQTGAEFFEGYWERLKTAGCARMVYIELEYWVNLPKKWQIIANKAAGDVFCLQAADCYPDKDRLARAREGLKKGHWTQDEKGHFYRVGMDKLIQWVQPKTGPFRTGLNMALRTELIKDLPDTNLNRGIDHWMLNHIDQKVKTVMHTNPGDFGSLDVDGVNNISTTRAVYFSRIVPPFEEAKLTIDQIMPDLADRLRGIKPKDHFINEQQNLKIMPKRVLLRKYQNHQRGDEIQVSACQAAQLEALGIVKQHVKVSRTIIHEKIEKNENSQNNQEHGRVSQGAGSDNTGQRSQVPERPASMRSATKKKRKTAAHRK